MLFRIKKDFERRIYNLKLLIIDLLPEKTIFTEIVWGKDDSFEFGFDTLLNLFQIISNQQCEE